MQITPYRKAPGRVKPPKRTKPLFIAGVSSVLALYLLVVGFWPIRMMVEATPLDISTPTESVDLPWPTEGNAALYAEGYGALGSTGSNDSVPIASITKTITALTILKAKPLSADQPGPTITFTEEDEAIYHYYVDLEGSVAPVSTGFSISQYNALRTMLLPSANNYADSLAVWAYGSMESYLEAANNYLDELGLTSTTVADASGFSPLSKSSSADLVKIGKLVLDNPVLKDIVSQPEATIRGVGTVYNTNYLLGELGIIGIKTGTTDEAGSCLLFASEHAVGNATVQMVGVVLGATDHAALWQSVETVLDTAQQAFVPGAVVYAGEQVATYAAPWGATVEATAVSDLSAPLWPALSAKGNVQVTPIGVKTLPGTVGSVASSSTPDHAAEVTIDRQLEGPGFLWRVTHPQRVFAR